MRGQGAPLMSPGPERPLGQALLGDLKLQVGKIWGPCLTSLCHCLGFICLCRPTSGPHRCMAIIVSSSALPDSARASQPMFPALLSIGYVHNARLNVESVLARPGAACMLTVICGVSI